MYVVIVIPVKLGAITILLKLLVSVCSQINTILKESVQCHCTYLPISLSFSYVLFSEPIYLHHIATVANSIIDSNKACSDIIRPLLLAFRIEKS